MNDCGTSLPAVPDADDHRQILFDLPSQNRKSHFRCSSLLHVLYESLGPWGLFDLHQASFLPFFQFYQRF
jgi:hypothetical protein